LWQGTLARNLQEEIERRRLAVTMTTATIGLVQSQRAEQRLSPALVAFAQALALTSAELEAAAEREATENPALELYNEHWRSPPRRDPNDILAAVPASANDRSRLRQEIRFAADGRLARVAELIVESLDERGFMRAELDELAPREEAERALALVRELGPAGIAARSARECLLLQLERLESTPVHELAHRILETQLEELAHGSYATIARRLGVDRGDVLGALELIRERLTPFPAFADGEASTPVARPDVLISFRDGELEVELADALRLRVDPRWRSAVLDRRLSPDERSRVRAHVVNAHSFVTQIERRRRTLLAVARCVVERQREFVLLGRLHLRRLTRAAVARELRLHESTVGRATTGKHVLLPDGRLVPFTIFFPPSGALEGALAALLQEANAPCSDRGLAEELGRRGFTVSRRTVAKYRDRLGAPVGAAR
jgi:RNA polymerase sigma-54 factor